MSVPPDSAGDPLAPAPEGRRDFCRSVLENLSDVIEGDAPEDLCREIDRVLGDCRTYIAFRSTLEETIRLTRALGKSIETPDLDEERFRRCIEAVRDRLDL